VPPMEQLGALVPPMEQLGAQQEALARGVVVLLPVGSALERTAQHAA
jgi:hypothetical protein